MSNYHCCEDKRCNGGCQLAKEPTDAIEFYKAHKQQIYDLIDIVWNEATESPAVPDYTWSDKMIEKWLAGLK